MLCGLCLAQVHDYEQIMAEIKEDLSVVSEFTDETRNRLGAAQVSFCHYEKSPNLSEVHYLLKKLLQTDTQV